MLGIYYCTLGVPRLQRTVPIKSFRKGCRPTTEGKKQKCESTEWLIKTKDSLSSPTNHWTNWNQRRSYRLARHLLHRPTNTKVRWPHLESLLVPGQPRQDQGSVAPTNHQRGIKETPDVVALPSSHPGTIFETSYF